MSISTYTIDTYSTYMLQYVIDTTFMNEPDHMGGRNGRTVDGVRSSQKSARHERDRLCVDSKRQTETCSNAQWKGQDTRGSADRTDSGGNRCCIESMMPKQAQ